MAKTKKPALSPEEKTAAADIRKANLAAANKKRAADKAAEKAENTPPAEKPPVAEDQAPEETPAIAEMSSEFNTILADIKAGKEVTLEGEPGVYFRFEDNRLKKFSKQGGHMDSYPLYAFQERKGWALKK